MENETVFEGKDAKTYEIGYLLTPFFPAEGLEETVEAMYKSWITDLGGELVFKTVPKMRALAYAVDKFINNKKSTFKEAYFGAIKFQISPEKIRSIKEIIEKDPNIVRFLMINVPKNSERVYIPRGTGIRHARPVEGKAEKGEEMSSEEIDKEIEGLLDTQTA